MLCKIRKFYEVLIIKVPETEVVEHLGFSADNADQAAEYGQEFVNDNLAEPNNYDVYVKVHPMEARK